MKSPASSSPLLSLVISMYGVETYLPDFLVSLDAQTINPSQVELIFINDGSPDKSGEIASEWLSGSSYKGSVFSKPNGGLSSARNFGLQQVTTNWVSFPDPDDFLDCAYLHHVIDAIKTHGDKTALITTNIKFYNEINQIIEDTHPLRVKFGDKSQMIDLNRHSDYIHLSAATAFYRKDIIVKSRLEFESAIKPNFEDGVFTSKYLLECDRPLNTLVPSAEYYYRRRSDGSSMVQTAWAKKEKYTTLPRKGYLNLLKYASKRHSSVPTWLQNTVLYDIFWFLREDDRIHSGCSNIPKQWSKKFHATLRKVMTYIESSNIEDFSVIRTHWHHRQMLIFGYGLSKLSHTTTSVNALEVEQGIVRLRYCYGPAEPVEEYRARGLRIRPVHETRRSYTLLGKTLMTERIVWLPATGTLSLRLNAHKVALNLGGYQDSPFEATPARIWTQLGKRAVPEVYGRGISYLQSGKKDLAVRPSKDVRALHQIDNIVHGARKELLFSLQGDTLNTINEKYDFPSNFNDYSPEQITIAIKIINDSTVKRYISNVWIFVDRDNQANDNAEHLYRYVHERRTDINAWFALKADSPDWDRLKKDGFKLVEFGSFEYLILLKNSINLISSQVDHYIVNPYDRKSFGGYPWKFTFLQHGVTQNNVSRWLNGKPIDLMVVASMHELTDLTQTNSEYRFSSKEVKLTGFPRFDSLYRARSSQLAKDQKTILIMPTWRRSLLGDQTESGNLRNKLDSFNESDYAKKYQSLLSSRHLKEYADRNNLLVGFMPHPNMKPYLNDFKLPDYVQLFSYDTHNVQDVILNSAVCVTDYSSVVFDAAYSGIPIVYYQFDQKDFYDGTHVFRRGRWTYEEDGLGPVCTNEESAMKALERIADNSFEFAEPFSSRMTSTFGSRHANACVNVVEEIENLRRPLSYERMYTKI